MGTVLSIDWDFFVRERAEWDFSGAETAFHLSGMIWMLRAGQFLATGQDLRRMMDPALHALPQPEQFWPELVRMGWQLRGAEVVCAESHAAAYPTILAHQGGAPERIVHIDAHHDLGYHGPGQLERLNEEGKVLCDTWLAQLAQLDRGMRGKIVYPAWKGTVEMDAAINAKGGHVWPELVPGQFQFGVWSDGLCVPEPGWEQVELIFICRSGAWTPPWLDPAFKRFVGEAGVVTRTMPWQVPHSIDCLSPRPFSWKEVEAFAGQMASLEHLTLPTLGGEA